MDSTRRVFLQLTDLSSDVTKESIEKYLENAADVHNVTMLGDGAASAVISGINDHGKLY